MKRLLSLLLCLIMVLSVFPFGASAADTLTVNTESGSKRSVNVGDTFTYSYAIRINGTYDLDRVRLDILFDETCLQVTEKVVFPTFGSAQDNYSACNKTGDLTIEKSTITNASQYNSGISTIVTVTFKAIRAGTTWIRTLPERIETESAGDSDHYLIDMYRPYNAARSAMYSSYDYLGTAAPNASSTALKNNQDVVWFYVVDDAGNSVGAGQTFKLSGTAENGKTFTYNATTDKYGFISFGVVNYGTYFLSCTSKLSDGRVYCIDNPAVSVPSVESGKLVVRKTVDVRALNADEVRSVVIKTSWTNEEIEPNVPYTGDRPESVYMELTAGGKVYAQGYFAPGSTTVTIDRMPINDAGGNALKYELNLSPVEHYTTTVKSVTKGFNVTFKYKNDHEWTKTSTDPTCESNGRETFTCSDCGKVYTYTLAALGHDYSESGYDATCTQDGYHLYVCKRCNKWEVQTPKATGHQWSSWKTDKAATDTTDGQRSRYCTVCNETETQLIHAGNSAGHTYKTVVVEPTCTEGGYTEKVCACGDSFIVEGSRTVALGHDYTGNSSTRTVIENTCTEGGLEEFTCSRCGQMHAEKLKAHGHNYEVTEQREATCTETGLKKTKCAYCGDTRTIRSAALGHQWGDWIVDEPATATTNGSKHRVCTRCLQEEVAVIPVTGEGHVHNYTEKHVVEPTCDERGYTEYLCPTDGDSFIDTDSYKDALGHDWEEMWRQESTKKTRGVIQYKCSRCGQLRYESMPRQEGSWENPFWDVGSKDWFYDNVRYVAYNEYMTGTSATRFDPGSSMTRAMLVTVLYRMVGEPDVKSQKEPFTDVKSGTWYSDAVTWAYNTGVVKGVSETEFAPNTTITREQMVTIFYRYANYAGYDTSGRKGLSSFSDAKSISAYAQDAFAWAVDAGIINGFESKGTKTLQPQGTATRAQAAKIIQTFDDWRINL